MMLPAALAAAAPLADPETIRRTVAEVIARPHYQIDAPPQPRFLFLQWLAQILRWIIAPFRWLFDALHGLPEVLRWVIVVGLAIALVLLVGHIGYTLVTAMRGTRRGGGPVGLPGRRRADPEALEREATQAAERREFIAAVRLLFRAGLLRLEQSEKRKFRAGTTNREHLRRYRGTPVFEPLERFVETIDLKWFGGGTCGPADYEACRDAYLQITRLARVPPNVDRS